MEQFLNQMSSTWSLEEVQVPQTLVFFLSNACIIYQLHLLEDPPEDPPASSFRMHLTARLLSTQDFLPSSHQDHKQQPTPQQLQT